MKSTTMQAAHVAEAELAADFVGGLEVDLRMVASLVLAALVAAGVDVNGRRAPRFGR
jgi:hypothetical protein